MNREVRALMAAPVLTAATPLGLVLLAHVSGPRRVKECSNGIDS